MQSSFHARPVLRIGMIGVAFRSMMAVWQRRVGKDRWAARAAFLGADLTSHDHRLQALNAWKAEAYTA